MKRPMQSPRTARHQTLVRNIAGTPLLCCWDDCEKTGYEQHKVVVREAGHPGNAFEAPVPAQPVAYIFCSERHKRMHIAGHRSYGNLNP